MKKYLLLFLLLCVGFTAHTQQFFNVRNALNSFAANVTSVIPLNNNYYCTGICWDSTNLIQGTDSAWIVFGVKFAVFDSTGQKIRDTVYQEWGYRNTIFSWQPTTKLLPDTTLLVAGYDIDSSQSHLLLLRFDTLGHKLNRWEYNKPLMCQNAWTDFWHLIDFKPCENHSWLMLSTIACGDSSYAGNYMLLSKLDSNLNLIWDKEYGDLPHNSIAGALLVEPDGSGYVLGGGG